MNTQKRQDRRCFLSFSRAVLFVLLLPSIVLAGQFSVTPIMLIFEGDTKSGVVNISNEEDKTLQVQMKAFEWTQNETGQDQYTETSDILFFPKIMTIGKKDQRILRAGIKAPPGAKEKTYRLFIEEIPEPKRDAKETQIQVAIRFGVPIFVKPIKEEIQGKIERVALGKDQIQTVVRNTGNAHFVIHSVTIKGWDRNGAETFSKELSGWYLLPNTVRTYTTPITEEVCRDTSRFDVEVKTNGFTLDDRLDVDKTLCLP
ncbi:MAG: molecular chaperone [Nitrospirae bacterium]|nr:molecular chaperone [Nitrospirota bacterium]